VNRLYLLELRPDPLALLRFLRGRGLEAPGQQDDFGYGVHAWLRAAFDSLAPQPWRLFTDRRRALRILGYGAHDAADMRRHLAEFADPPMFAVCPDPDELILGKPMPAWQRGRRLGFELQCCPVGRTSENGTEKDLFLLRADAAGAERLSREAVYCAWAAEHLQLAGACAVTAARMTGFRLVRQQRRPEGPDGHRASAHLVRPQVLVQGELTVGDPEAFAQLLAGGIGRHKAFGYGMLLLRPAP